MRDGDGAVTVNSIYKLLKDTVIAVDVSIEPDLGIGREERKCWNW